MARKSQGKPLDKSPSILGVRLSQRPKTRPRASGANTARPVLAKTLAALRSGGPSHRRLPRCCASGASSCDP